MLLFALKYVLWFTHPCLQALIAGTMLRRKLYREYPIFLVYTVSHVVRFVMLFWIYHRGNRDAYRYAFLCAEVVDAALAFGTVHELYRGLLRSYSGVQKFASIVFRATLIVLLAAAVVSAATAPAADTSRLLAGVFTLDRAAAVVRGGLLLLLFLLSCYFGLRWQHFAFGIAAGFALQSSVALATYALHAHFGLLGKPILSVISAAAYNCAVFIWLAYLFSPEPVPRPGRLPSRLELDGWNETLLELLNQ